MYLANKTDIDLDIQRYIAQTPFSQANAWSLNYLLWNNKPFRSVFYYRTSIRQGLFKVLRRLLPARLPNIELGGKLQGGVQLLHHMGCVVYPHSAGKNLTVGQGVTIGDGKPNEQGIRSPILGENVRICTNAVVFGGITVGNNVTIGAGTVLNRSVPDNCTVVGNPARIVRRNGVSVDEPL